ncbi:hypothetical protein MTBGP_11930 [Moorella thermoacetica]
MIPEAIKGTGKLISRAFSYWEVFFINKIFASFMEKNGNNGIGLFLLAIGFITSLAVLYIIDVWILGPVAAIFAAAYKWLAGGLYGHPNYTTAWWYFQHPLATARAWLGGHLSQPEVRSWWIGLNVLIAVMWTLRRIAWQFDWTITKTNGIKIKKDDATYGSARWAVKSDLARVCDFGFGPGIVLGALGTVPVRIPPKPKTWMNRHVLVVGAPGSGKSRGYVRPNIFTAVRAGESVLVTDPKGELYRSMAGWLKSRGYTVKGFNLVQMEQSDHWNPLGEIRTPLDADVFAQVVISTTETGPKKGGDAFWDRAEQNLLKALALYVTIELPADKRHFGSLYDILAAGDFEQVDALFAKLPSSHPAKGPYNVYAMAGDNVKGGVVIGLGTRLQVFQQEMVRGITGDSDIDLTLPGKGKCAYFIITPDTHGAFDFLASLLFTFLFVRLVELADTSPNGRLPVQVRFLLDEFANIVSIPEFEKKIATVRSRGLDCHVIVQSIPQLERKYGRTWEEIMACCDTKLIIGVKDDTTARYVSHMLGESTVETRSATREVNPIWGQRLFDDRRSLGITGRELMTPDEIQKMRSKFCLVFLPDGTPPAKLKVLDYEQFPEAKELKKVIVTEKKEEEKEIETEDELNDGGNEDYYDTKDQKPVEDGAEKVTEENIKDGDKVIETEHKTGSEKTVVPW